MLNFLAKGSYRPFSELTTRVEFFEIDQWWTAR